MADFNYNEVAAEKNNSFVSSDNSVNSLDVFRTAAFGITSSDSKPTSVKPQSSAERNLPGFSIENAGIANADMPQGHHPTESLDRKPNNTLAVEGKIKPDDTTGRLAEAVRNPADGTRVCPPSSDQLPRLVDRSERLNPRVTSSPLESMRGDRLEAVNRDAAEGKPREADSSRWNDKIASAYKSELKASEMGVNKAVGDLKPALQMIFNSLSPNKDGSYSEKQMNFLRDFSKEGYKNAKSYNNALDGLRQLNNGGTVQESGPLKPDGKLAVKPGLDEKIKDSDNPKYPGKLEKADKLEKTDKIEKTDKLETTDKKLQFALDAVAKLPKALQQEFRNLPLVKDGVGYTKEHVAFVAENCGKVAAQALQASMDSRRAQMWGSYKFNK